MSWSRIIEKKGLQSLRQSNQSSFQPVTFDRSGADPISGSVCAITSEVVRELTLRSDPTLPHFQILKLWIDEYVGIVAGRHAIRAIASSHLDTMPAYSPLMINVPFGNVNQFEGDQATAIPLPLQVQAHASAPVPTPTPTPTPTPISVMEPSTEMDLGSYDSSAVDYSSLTLGTPFQLQSATTLRQSSSSMSSSVRDLVEPKIEPFNHQ